MSTEQNKANYRRFIEEAMNKGNVAVVDELASPGLVVHFLPPGTPPGAESLKRNIEATRAAFPDLRITVDEQFSVEDRILARCTIRGTQRGPFLNHLKTLMPPPVKGSAWQGSMSGASTATAKLQRFSRALTGWGCCSSWAPSQWLTPAQAKRRPPPSLLVH